MLNRPIAITGIGCRFPGAVVDPASYWRMLCDRVDAVTEVPASRWSIDLYYAAERGRTGKTYSKWGGFIADIDLFDAGFFGITDAEADAMDPQQRLMLLTAWEAMEDAGYVPQPKVERTGVFIGISTRDYELIQGAATELHDVSPFSATGLASSIASNRLSYCFNFTGPSMSVDTACSSSLLSVHLACQSLWNGECERAIAGGVNCLVGPNNYLAFSSMGLLSPDGRCRTFDVRANGFVRGEGAGAIFLQPLDEALASGARIYAVIRATGTNQDGHTTGLAFPNRDSQAALLRQVSREAGVAAHDVVYVEAHGTGTQAGDPVEASALGEVFGREREDGSKLLVGSVKSNIGHLESGAGIAGIIKCALCLKHGAAPPNLHFESPNPAIDLERWQLKVPTQLEEFPKQADGQHALWYAGVNSFGFGGSNAFALLSNVEEGVATSREAERPQPVMTLLPLSARDPERLPQLALSYAEHLRQLDPQDSAGLSDFALNAATRRSMHVFRMTVEGRSSNELRERLLAFARGEQTTGVTSGEAASRSGPVFVFSGQGAQWFAMGRQLYEREAVFREALQACDAALRRCGGWALLPEFLADEKSSRMMDTAIAQPAICAIQIALAAQWAHWGVRPAVAVGHSVGEVAAAYCAGVFTLDEAMQVIFHRGATMSAVTGDCGMLAATLTSQEAAEVVAPFAGAACVGAINGPQSVTLSGELPALMRISEELTRRGIWNRSVPVNYAFHSRQMDPVQQPLLAALSSLAPRSAQIPLFSTVTGQRVEGPELDAHYWWRNVREPVLFSPAIEAIAEQDYRTFVEIAAHPVLSTSLKQTLQACVTDDEAVVLPSLRKHEDDQAILLQSLGMLHCLGTELDWRKVLPAASGRYVSLPLSPWKLKRHWNEAPEWTRARDWRLKSPLLMRRVHATLPTWLCLINSRLLPYVKDHAIQGRPLFPATGYLELAWEAAAAVAPDQPCRLLDVELERALFLPEGGRGIDVRIEIDPSQRQFTIVNSTGGDDWTRNAKGCIQPRKAVGLPPRVNREQVRLRCQHELSADQFYAKTLQSSFHYGPMFRGVRQAWRRDGEVLAHIQQHESLLSETSRYRMHPALLDACLQLAFAVMREDDPHAPVGMFLPYAVERLESWAALPNQFWARAVLVKQGRSTLVVDLQAFDDEGKLLVELKGVKFRPMEGSDDENFMSWFYEHEWQLKPLPESELRSPLRPVANALPDWAEFISGLKQRGEAVRERLLLPHLLQQTRDAFQSLWAGYVWEALQQLGWLPEARESVTLDSLCDELGIPDDARSLMQNCMKALQTEGVLARSEGATEWRVTDRIQALVATSTQWSTLAEKYPALLSELILLKQGGEALSRALLCETNTRLATQDELLRLREQAVSHAPSWAGSHLVIRQAVAQLKQRLPKGRPLRILEVGAGTSGLSVHVVAELSTSSDEYHFTDARSLSPQAEDRIRQYGFGDCRSLSLECDPQSQGFEVGSVDLVIGQDPFTSKDLLIALQHVKSLLANGGLLVFSAWDADAWMRSVEAVQAPSTAGVTQPMTRAAWLRFLAEAGFEHADFVADVSPTAEIGRTTYLAQCPIAVPATSAATAAPSVWQEPRSWLVWTDRGGVGEAFAKELRQQGQVVRTLTTDNALNELPEILSSPLEGIVHVASLDAPSNEGLTLDSLSRAQHASCHAVLRLVQALGARSATTANPRLWLVTRGAQAVEGNLEPLSLAQAPLIGLGRVLTNEHPDLHCRLIDLCPRASVADNVAALMRELVTADRDDQIALRGEARYVERLRRMSTLDAAVQPERGAAEERPCQLRIGRPGMLDQLRLRPIERRAPEADEVEVRVCAAGLNFRDVMKSLGVYPGDAPDAELLGDEFAGIVTRVGSAVSQRRVGERVFGVQLGAMATHLTVPAGVCLPLPDTMSFEEGATIPVVYLTAYHALHQLARAKAGERILIHSAAGGVGLAALRLALKAGLEVFGTAGSAMKRQLLRNLGAHHCANSRTLDFADEVMALTNGEGVDIVLNSLAGEAIPRSLETLRLYGRFLEIGKRDIYGGTDLSLKPFRNSLSYFAIDMARTLVPPHAGPLLNEILTLLREGTVTPLPTQSFPFDEATRAFRYMAQGRHIGKLALTMDQAPVTRRAAYDASRLQCRPDATYLVTGGLRGLGLALAEHLARRGARYLVLTSQSGPTTDEAQAGLARLQSQGVTVLARKSDVCSEADLATLLAEVERTLPPLAGVFHAATVYGDGLLREMSVDDFERPLGPKAYGAWNLHQQTLKYRLELFVMISSISAVIGNAGQANYVAANVFLDTLAQHRRRIGLPALSLQLDRIRDVGHVARNQELADYFARLRWWGVSSEQAMEGMDRLLANRPAVGLLTSFKWTRGTSGISTLLGSPRFEGLVRDESSDTGSGAMGVRRRLDTAAPEEKPGIITEFLINEIADVLRISAKKVSLQRPLKEIGLDSLMAVELMTRVESKLGMSLPAQHLSADATVTSLANAALTLLGIGTAATPQLTPTTRDAGS